MSAHSVRRLTLAQCSAAIQMVEAALAGAEGEGDSTGLSFALLRRTSDALRAMRGDAQSKEQEALDKVEAAAPALADALEEARGYVAARARVDEGDDNPRLARENAQRAAAALVRIDAALRAAGRLP